MRKRLLFVKWLVHTAMMFFSLGCLLFVSAGTVYFPKAWIAIGAIIIPMIILGVVLSIKNPELLAGRMNPREQQQKQSLITQLGGCVVACSLIASGIDFRLGLSRLNQWAIWLGLPLILLSYWVYFLTFRENSCLFRTIKATDNQQLVSTGIYSVIRHPMYLATSLLYAGIAFVLSSFVAMLTFIIMFPLLYLRIKHEEIFLSQNLPGYSTYMSKVKFRIIPHIW